MYSHFSLKGCQRACFSHVLVVSTIKTDADWDTLQSKYTSRYILVNIWWMLFSLPTPEEADGEALTKQLNLYASNTVRDVFHIPAVVP